MATSYQDIWTEGCYRGDCIIHTLNNEDANVGKQADVLYQCRDLKKRRNASLIKILLLKTNAGRKTIHFLSNLSKTILSQKATDIIL